MKRIQMPSSYAVVTEEEKELLGGGGAFAYIKFIKPKQGAKVSADPDDYEFEDEEYENEDIHLRRPPWVSLFMADLLPRDQLRPEPLDDRRLQFILTKVAVSGKTQLAAQPPSVRAPRFRAPLQCVLMAFLGFAYPRAFATSNPQNR